jgi:N-methylhydantoinase B
MSTIQLDPVLVPVVERMLVSVCQEINLKVKASAYSNAMARSGDMGSAVLDAKGRFIAVWTGTHVGGAHISLQGMLERIGRENLRPGDFILSNDPYIMAFRHAQDWHFFYPVFYEGELMFYLYLIGHQHDSGGAYPFGYFPGIYDIHGETTLVPPVKLFKEGKLNGEADLLIYANVRGANMMRADHLLVYQTMVRAEQRILTLCKAYGKEAIKAAVDQSIVSTEKVLRGEISKWKGGTYYSETVSDSDGTTRDPIRVRLKLTVDPRAGELVFDYTDNPEQVHFINCGRGLVWCSTITALRWSLPADMHDCHGYYNICKVETKKGTVFEVTYPATVGATGICLAGEVIELVQLAVAQAAPNLATAPWTRNVNPPLVGTDRSKMDPRTGSPRVYSVVTFHPCGSSGAVWGYDGWHGLTGPQNGGKTLRASLEPYEALGPWRILQSEWRTDSGGQGRWRGSVGTHVEFLNEHDPTSFKIGDSEVFTGSCNGERRPPRGMLGGTDGKRTDIKINRKGKFVKLHTMSSARSLPGDIVVAKSGGGGGVGHPLDREMEKVREDALNEYISLKTARDIYGVVLDPQNFEVDQKATAELRNAKKKSKSYRTRYVPEERNI